MPGGKDDPRATREAQLWFARLRGPATPADRKAFDAWHAAHPDNAAAYARLTRKWQAQWGQIANTPTGRARSLPDRRQRNVRRYALAAAASILLVVGGVTMGPRILPSAASAQSGRFETKVGEIRSFSLPDGTKVTLDTDSAVSYVFAERDRKALLERGRARFALRNAGENSLVVRASDVNVTGQGGVFDIDRDSGGVHVRVVKGTVKSVAPATNAIGTSETLVAGAVSTYGNPTALGTSNPLDWPSGMLTFKDTSLRDAVAEINRYAAVPIKLSDDVGMLRVTATVRAADTIGFARSLAAAFGLHVEMSNDAITVGRKLE